MVGSEGQRAQDEQIERALTPAKDDVPVSAEEKTAALELLRDPRLLDRVLEDFDRCGVVGEETNKRIAYLAAVSRLLEKPLAIVVQSSSSAGKSSLMEAVLDFMPEEQRESYTAMTGQATRPPTSAATVATTRSHRSFANASCVSRRCSGDSPAWYGSGLNFSYLSASHSSSTSRRRMQ